MYQPKHVMAVTPVARPAVNSGTIIEVESGQRFGLSFAVSSVERVEADLEIKGQGCGVVRLLGFYVVEEPPALVLADGTEPPVLAMLHGDVFWLTPPAPDEGAPFYLAFRFASNLHPLDDIGYIQQSTDESDTIFGVSENCFTLRITSEGRSFESDFLPAMDLSAHADLASAENDVVKYYHDWWATTGVLERGSELSSELIVSWYLAAETLYDGSLLIGNHDSESVIGEGMFAHDSSSADFDILLPMDTAEYCCILSDQLVRASYDAGTDPDAFFFTQLDNFLDISSAEGHAPVSIEEHASLEPVADMRYEEQGNCSTTRQTDRMTGQVCTIAGASSKPALDADAENRLEPEPLFGQLIGIFGTVFLPIEPHSEDYLSQCGVSMVFFSPLCSTADKEFPLGASGWDGVSFTVYESDQIETLGNLSNSTELFLLQQGLTGN